MSRSERHTRTARAAADFLDSIGEHKRAEDVRAVCRSLSMARATMSAIHRDNMKLRGEPTCPSSTPTACNGPARITGAPRKGEHKCPICEGEGRLKHSGPIGVCDRREDIGAVKTKRAKPEGL